MAVPSRHRAVALAEFDAPNSLWNRAVDVAGQVDPFCCRGEWQFSFHDTFAPQRPLHLRSYGTSAIAFAENSHPQVGALLEPVESSWLFGCPVLGEHGVDLLAELVAELSRAHPWNVLVSGVVAGSALQRGLVARFARHFDIFELQPNVSLSASLAGGFDGWLSRRTGRMRRNLRGQQRRARQRGVTFERVAPTSVAASDRAWERMLAVERRSWKGLGRCGMDEVPSRDFYRVMLRRLVVSDGGRVMFARHADDDIGFIFGGVAGPVYRGQQFSFVEEHRDGSIGNLLQLEQLRWLCEEGVARYDMGPAMDYKWRWTEIEQRGDAWLLRPRGES